MCLAIPGKVLRIDGDIAIIDYNGEFREAGLVMLPDVQVGEFVIVSARMIMQRVPAKEAEAMLAMWDETDRVARDA